MKPIQLTNVGGENKGVCRSQPRRKKTGEKATETSGGTSLHAKNALACHGLKLPTAKPAKNWTAAWWNFQGVPLIFAVLYLRDGEGAGGPNNRDTLIDLAAVLLAYSVPWVIVADWNFTPEELRAESWDTYFDGFPMLPLGCTYTCSSGKGRMLDYAMVSWSARGLVTSIAPVFKVPWGPHSGIRVNFAETPSQLKVRKLIAPKPPQPDRDRPDPKDHVAWKAFRDEPARDRRWMAAELLAKQLVRVFPPEPPRWIVRTIGFLAGGPAKTKWPCLRRRALRVARGNS